VSSKRKSGPAGRGEKKGLEKDTAIRGEEENRNVP